MNCDFAISQLTRTNITVINMQVLTVSQTTKKGLAKLQAPFLN